MRGRYGKAILSLSLAFLCWSMAGCLELSPKQVYTARKRVSVEAEQLCQELQQIGELNELRSKIRSDMTVVRKLLGSENLEEVKEQILTLAKRVQNDSARLAAMIGPRYSEQVHDLTLVWRLGPERLGIARSESPIFWMVSSAQVRHVADWQGENPDLNGRVEIDYEGSGLEVTLKRKASALEICQLQETVAVALQVNLQNTLGYRSQLQTLLLGQPKDVP